MAQANDPRRGAQAAHSGEAEIARQRAEAEAAAEAEEKQLDETVPGGRYIDDTGVLRDAEGRELNKRTGRPVVASEDTRELEARIAELEAQNAALAQAVDTKPPQPNDKP